MKKIVWDPAKAALLRNDRLRGNVGFEEAVIAIEGGKVLDIVPNPSANHAGQRMFVLDIGGYAFCVPYVETGGEIFLKTVFPSRKHTAIYLTE